MAPAATDLANLARQMGLGNLVPKGFDPNDANAFNKLATDLVFTSLKQLPGQPRVSEIEGLQRANPNISMTPEANVEILNNALAYQRWMDARANLAGQFIHQYPGQLTQFDSAFNKAYPEIDVYNAVANAAQKMGYKMPGSTPAVQLPAAALGQLKVGIVSHFRNGQSWTLGANGVPQQVQ